MTMYITETEVGQYETSACFKIILGKYEISLRGETKKGGDMEITDLAVFKEGESNSVTSDVLDDIDGYGPCPETLMKALSVITEANKIGPCEDCGTITELSLELALCRFKYSYYIYYVYIIGIFMHILNNSFPYR